MWIKINGLNIIAKTKTITIKLKDSIIIFGFTKTNEPQPFPMVNELILLISNKPSNNKHLPKSNNKQSVIITFKCNKIIKIIIDKIKITKAIY